LRLPSIEFIALSKPRFGRVFAYTLAASARRPNMPFLVHPYLGNKDIQHTLRYTEMPPDRFKDFWRG